MEKTKCVALLRGINVGGNNLLPMRDLAKMFADAGCEKVRTFIQSGNVLFSATGKSMAKLPERISARIAKDFGLKVPVILRTEAQMEAVVSGNPFAKADAMEDRLYVMFLMHKPDKSRLSGLESVCLPGEEFAVRGQEIYLKLPNGVARTKLSNAYFDSRLATVGTQRNWRTTNRLLELLREDAA